MRELGNGSFDVVIHAAAVGDYSIANIEAGGVVSQPGTGKIDSGQNVSIRLRPNAKLVDHLRSWSGNPDLRVVAFKLTNGADELTAKRAIDGLFDHSQADAVVHNDLVQNDEKSGAFPATIWSPNGSRLAVDNRHDLAAAIARVLDDVASTKTPVRPVANPS
jgi:phosphopantothenoylcysteine synthetase/decarboxylase